MSGDARLHVIARRVGVDADLERERVLLARFGVPLDGARHRLGEQKPMASLPERPTREPT